MKDLVFYNLDYKEVLKKIKRYDTKIDLILTDPPYCVSRTHQLGFSNMGRSGMDYGEWDYDFNQQEWIREVAPYLRNGGSIIIFNDWKNMSYLAQTLESLGFIIKDLIRLEKSNPMPRNVNARYVIDFEVAIWAVKGKKRWVFNKPNDISYLKPSFKCSVVIGKNRIHPTQKPLNVFEELVKIHSNKGDLIFDPFSGSGTTAIAALKNGRKFLGSEIDKSYYERAKKRIEREISEKKLFYGGI